MYISKTLKEAFVICYLNFFFLFSFKRRHLLDNINLSILTHNCACYVQLTDLSTLQVLNQSPLYFHLYPVLVHVLYTLSDNFLLYIYKVSTLVAFCSPAKNVD